MSPTSQETISGYDLGDESIIEAPISDEEFDRLKQSATWSEDDGEYLRMAGEVLDGQVDDVHDTWYGFVGDHGFLLCYCTEGEGNPNEEYLDRVRERFGQWIRDSNDPPYDREWLDYQFDIGRRHHRTAKDQTDDADSVPIIDFRYVVALVYPITATIRGFLENGEHSAEVVDATYHA